jgi:hypothetical protein
VKALPLPERHPQSKVETAKAAAVPVLIQYAPVEITPTSFRAIAESSLAGLKVRDTWIVDCNDVEWFTASERSNKTGRDPPRSRPITIDLFRHALASV